MSRRVFAGAPADLDDGQPVRACETPLMATIGEEATRPTPEAEGRDIGHTIRLRYDICRRHEDRVGARNMYLGRLGGACSDVGVPSVGRRAVRALKLEASVDAMAAYGDSPRLSRRRVAGPGDG